MTALVTSPASFLFCRSDLPDQSFTITCGIAFSFASAGRTKRRTKQRGSDECGAEHRYRARKKHRFQSDDSRDQPERGAAQSERHVEKNGVGAHGEAPALRRSAPHRFNAEPGIDQRIAEPGERG